MQLVKGYYEKRGFECSSAKQVYFEQGDEGIKYSVELPKNVGWKHTERGATQSKVLNSTLLNSKFLPFL